jgi:hypothetical protein
MNDSVAEILTTYPFLSYGSLLDIHYLGIIQNSDTQLLSMYVLDSIPDEELRRRFLDLGNEWWWESNRAIPINIFHGSLFRDFRPYLKHFARKDFQLIAGPSVSLQETIARRVRKRQVTLVRRPD